MSLKELKQYIKQLKSTPKEKSYSLSDSLRTDIDSYIREHYVSEDILVHKSALSGYPTIPFAGAALPQGFRKV